MKPSTKIAAFHLLNDYSGSPLVFSQALNALHADGHEIILHTSNPDSGFLADVTATAVIRTPYRFHTYGFRRLAAFIYSQIITFMQVLKYRKEDVVIYVNTLLPFGAALAGKLTGKKVVYHLHETSIRPLILLKFLSLVARFTASKAIYVSKYLHEQLPLKNVNSEIIYNSLPEHFLKQVKENSAQIKTSTFTVLMVCSLKRYKGIFEYIAMSRRHPSLKFEMVINASAEEITDTFLQEDIPSNLTIFAVQKTMHSFYQRANLVVNLTNPAMCVETFGMTLLEAMSYGIPVIAPPVGGPAEIVNDDVNGYTADVRNTAYMDQLLQKISTQTNEHIRLSASAKESAKKFSGAVLEEKIKDIFRSQAVA